MSISSTFHFLPRQFSTNCHINIIMYWQLLNKSPWPITPGAPVAEAKVKNEQQRLQFKQPEHMRMVLHKAHSGFLQVITAV